MWETAGSPLIPAVAHGGGITSFVHVSQLAKALGLAEPAPRSASAAAEAAGATMLVWLNTLATVEWSRILEPTPSRGRAVREITVTGFRPFALLPEAWTTGSFGWESREDAAHAAELADAPALQAFCGQIERAWSAFARQHAAELDRSGPLVRSSRGTLLFADLVEAYALHISYHLAEVEASLVRGAASGPPSASRTGGRSSTAT